MFAQLFNLDDDIQVLYRIKDADKVEENEEGKCLLQVSTQHEGVFIDALIGPMPYTDAHAYIESVNEGIAKEDRKVLLKTGLLIDDGKTP